MPKYLVTITVTEIINVPTRAAAESWADFDANFVREAMPAVNAVDYTVEDRATDV